MTKAEVLKQAKELLAERPNLTTTEIAQALAGGYKGDHYPKYIKATFILNDLKREGRL